MQLVSDLHTKSSMHNHEIDIIPERLISYKLKVFSLKKQFLSCHSL